MRKETRYSHQIDGDVRLFLTVEHQVLLKIGFILGTAVCIQLRLIPSF